MSAKSMVRISMVLLNEGDSGHVLTSEGSTLLGALGRLDEQVVELYSESLLTTLSLEIESVLNELDQGKDYTFADMGDDPAFRLEVEKLEQDPEESTEAALLDIVQGLSDEVWRCGVKISAELEEAMNAVLGKVEAAG